jgi:aryl-alcohol dehydrogenase-like predicted oxidoreductase
MKYRKLGHSDLKVSEVCLGSMTWGEQNTEAEGHEQIDYALDNGVNFIDTAEMYSVPGSKETQGSTERIIGGWFKKTGRRDDVVLATKVTGPNPGLSYLRDPLAFTPEQIRTAIEGNLKRLQTDYVDIYQLHWPERKANFFGKLDYDHDENDPWEDNFAVVLETLNELIKEGKIKHYGVSNETPWGVMRMVQTAKELGLPNPLTIQNPYSLLNRSYEVGLAEVSIREDIPLLAYSPLAFGVLSGKYMDGKRPEEGRIVKFPQFSRYNNQQAQKATARYAELAKDNGISLVQLALQWVNTRRFVGSNIIGATSLTQLKENIGSVNLDLTNDLLEGIRQIHKDFSHPAP